MSALASHIVYPCLLWFLLTVFVAYRSGGEKAAAVNEYSLSDSSKSMKHLIAAAQAKRREAQARCPISENPIPTLASPQSFVHGGSPSPATLISFPANFPQKDAKGAYASIPFDSPSAAPQELCSTNKVEPQLQEYEQRISPEYKSQRGSPSGSTEAAVARDALEGMIETLSRTKDSIGRATRLAIDCAKYGISGEVSFCSLYIF